MRYLTLNEIIDLHRQLTLIDWLCSHLVEKR